MPRHDRASGCILCPTDGDSAVAANLPEPDAIADEIVADLESALEQFCATAEDLK